MAFKYYIYNAYNVNNNNFQSKKSVSFKLKSHTYMTHYLLLEINWLDKEFKVAY